MRKYYDKITIVIDNDCYFKGTTMPAKKIISKRILLDAALQIVRESGIDELNMRTLAKRCNCSTQPIYLSFNGAEELKAELGKRIAEELDIFIGKQISKGDYPEYKAIGMGYIKFAVEEPELFKYLFMRRRTQEYGEKNSFDKSTYVIMQKYGLYKDDAVKLQTEMWLFVHGIATMLATGYLDWDWQTISEMVTDVFIGLKDKQKGVKN